MRYAIDVSEYITIKTNIPCKYCGSTKIQIILFEEPNDLIDIRCDKCKCFISPIKKQKFMRIIKTLIKKQWKTVMTFPSAENNCPFCNQKWNENITVIVIDEYVGWIECRNCNSVSPTLELTEDEIRRAGNYESCKEELKKKVKKMWCNLNASSPDILKNKSDSKSS